MRSRPLGLSESEPRTAADPNAYSSRFDNAHASIETNVGHWRINYLRLRLKLRRGETEAQQALQQYMQQQITGFGIRVGTAALYPFTFSNIFFAS